MTAIDDFADDLLYLMLSLSPDLAAEMGLDAVGARALPKDTVLDFSDEASAARTAMMAERAVALARMDSAGLSGEDALTRRILHYLLEDGLFWIFRGRSGHRFLDNPYPVNHLTGYHPLILMMLTRDQVVRTIADAEAYLARLSALPAAISGVTDTLRAHLAGKILAPRFSLVRALADMRSFVSPQAEANILVSSFETKLTAAGLDNAGRARLAADAAKIVAGEIVPAYQRLIAATQDAIDATAEERGAWSLPDGEAYYDWLLRGHTTSDLTAVTAHETGMEEIARVQDEIRAGFASLGIRGDGMGELFAQITDAPRFRYSKTKDGRAELWSHATQLMNRFESGAAALFHARPRGALQLVEVPAELEDSMHTHYTPPSVDGARPGRFSLNVKSALANPRWELATLCAHEGSPGHHIQLALAQELPLGSAFRRTIVFNAYIEGWAKYAETIPETFGMLDDPYARLGRLRAELYSTVNLAMDTGIHAKRWTRGKAREFFRVNTGVAEEFADAIVDRSFVTPGQLCSYKIGMMSFLGARDNFRKARGAHFDIREFHDCVLRHGALPLRLLDDVVTSTIRTNARQSFAATGSA